MRRGSCCFPSPRFAGRGKTALGASAVALIFLVNASIALAAGNVTSASMLPLPAAVRHSAPAPLAAQVQLNPVSGAGSASRTSASATFDGPALLTTMV